MYLSLVLVSFLYLFTFGTAHESCCMSAMEDESEEFIVDVNGESASKDTFEGRDQIIPNEDLNSIELDKVENISQPRIVRNLNNAARKTLMDKIIHEFKVAAPWVTLGTAISAFLSVIPLPLDIMRNHLNVKKNKTALGILFSLIKASIIGLLTPLCSCGALPLATSFVANGVPLSSVFSFLTASQSAGIDSAVITWGLLGPMATISRLLGAIVLAVAVGVAIAVGEEPNQASKTEPAKKKQTLSLTHFVTKLLRSLFSTAYEIFPAVILGLVLSTSIVHYIPFLKSSYKELQHFSFVGPFLLRLGVLALALPLQICEHATVTFAAGIQKAGGSPGLAFAFLLSAPATNLPTLLLLLQSARKNDSLHFSVISRLSVALVFSALMLSYFVDIFGIDMLIEKEAFRQHH